MILLIILCSIFGVGLILSTAGFFFFKNKWKKKKKLREEEMAAKLYEKLINEEDEKLRKEIEDAIDAFNMKDAVVSGDNKEKSNTQNISDDLYLKCMSFVRKMTGSANYFLELWKDNDPKIKQFMDNLDVDSNEYFKAKDKLNNFSDKAFDFLAKNKDNINKIQKMKDIWKDEK